MTTPGVVTIPMEPKTLGRTLPEGDMKLIARDPLCPENAYVRYRGGSITCSRVVIHGPSTVDMRADVPVNFRIQTAAAVTVYE